MRRTVEIKIYPTAAQIKTLDAWLRTCGWLYNKALDMRIKAYKRRGKSVTFPNQTKWLTGLRHRREDLGAVPYEIAKSPLRRLDCAMRAFFRRCKAGGKPGFPRFRPSAGYSSVENLSTARYVRGDGLVRVPRLGAVRCRGDRQKIAGAQKCLRILRRADGWYAQISTNDGVADPPRREPVATVGIDLGLSTFAALSTGETIDNPRFLAHTARGLRAAHRRVSRRVKGSKRRRKAVARLKRTYERLSRQRRNFAHQHSTDLVRRFDLIAVEDLNVRGLASGRLAKSVNAAAWTMFLNQLRSKAESAGVEVRAVDPRGTSQTCPSCGSVRRKELSERVHSCERCGLTLDRDVAAARVILDRALGVSRAVVPVEDETAVVGASRHHVSPVKREGLFAH